MPSPAVGRERITCHGPGPRKRSRATHAKAARRAGEQTFAVAHTVSAYACLAASRSSTALDLVRSRDALLYGGRPPHEPRGHAEHVEFARHREPRLLVEGDVLGTVGLKVAKLPAHVDDGAVGSQEMAPEPFALHVRADGDRREMPMNLLGVTLPPGAEPLGNAGHRVRDESDERRHDRADLLRRGTAVREADEVHEPHQLVAPVRHELHAGEHLPQADFEQPAVQCAFVLPGATEDGDIDGIRHVRIREERHDLTEERLADAYVTN